MSGSHVLETRPSKRSRLSADDLASSADHSSGSSTASVSLQCHPEIWFDDGNLVLITHKTTFRIYRGLLAAQSTMFSDMFVSSTSSPDEAWDRCPVVHLSDSPYDLVHLLRVLLPKSRIHYYMPSANPTRTFNKLSTVIRLAHKYNIPQVQEQALTSLHEYGEFVTSFSTYSNPSPNSELALHPWLNIAIVNLARLTNTPSLLPLTLYCCTNLGGDLFDGWTHEDGTVEYLAEADLRQCFEVRATLTCEHSAFLSALFDETISVACARPAYCGANLHNAQRSAFGVKGMVLQLDMLRNWVGVITLLGNGGTICRGCTAEMLERTREGQRRIFDKLPEIFGITVEGWGRTEEEAEGVPTGGQGDS